MSEEILRELRQMQQYAAMLQGLLDEAQGRAPERSQGEDSAAVVGVVLDSAGIPVEIRVGSGWERQIEAAALGAAVLDAFGQAAQTRTQAWAASLESGTWADRIGKMMEADSAGRPVATPIQEVPQLFRRDQAPAPSRPVNELAEEMISAFDRVDDIAKEAAAAQEHLGVDSSGKARVTLSQAGLIGCAVEETWASGRSGEFLTRALNQALSAARDRMRAQAGVPTAQGQLDSLLNEAMTLLNDPRRLAGS